MMVGCTYEVNWSLELVKLVPPGDTTVTCNVSGLAPEVSAGDTAVIDVSLLTVKAANAEPKSTPVAAVNPSPEMFTLVAPVAGPIPGEIPVTLGLGVNVLARSKQA